jgi:putative salt-induced outer membrane protein YdiY
MSVSILLGISDPPVLTGNHGVFRMRRPATLICLITSLACAVSLFPPPDATGQQETPAQQADPPKTVPAWKPPAPAPEAFDWIRLTSGEWLKGDIIQMREETLDFESDKLEDQTFDWEDIAAIRSPREYTYVFADRTALTGTAVIADGKVVVAVDGEEHIRERADLMSIVPDLSRKGRRWDGKTSIGFTFRKGNTDQQDFTGQGYLRRQGKLSRARFDYNGSFGVSDGEETSNNHRGVLKLDIFLSPRFYVTPAAIEVFHDALQNIQVRLTPSAGVGYHAVKKKKVSLDLELAGGYQIVWYSSVDPGEDDQQERGVVVPTLRLESEPLRWLDVDALYTAQVSGGNARNTTQHGELTLSVELTKVFDLDVSWIWDHVENPSPNEDGTIPKKDDLKLTLGIGIDF